jgi:N-acetyltransferase 10
LNATKRGEGNLTVSVKAGSKAKRTAGPTATEIYEEAIGHKKDGKAKKLKK